MVTGEFINTCGAREARVLLVPLASKFLGNPNGDLTCAQGRAARKGFPCAYQILLPLGWGGR